MDVSRCFRSESLLKHHSLFVVVLVLKFLIKLWFPTIGRYSENRIVSIDTAPYTEFPATFYHHVMVFAVGCIPIIFSIFQFSSS